MKIATFNVRYGSANDGKNSWEYRRQIFYNLLNRYDWDILCLQECEFFQLEEILHNVQGYSFVGVGRDDGDKCGEMCSILYKHSNFKLIESETFWFCNDPYKPGCTSYGNSIPRICTWAQILSNSQSIYIFNLHLDHQSQKSRLQSISQLFDFIKNIQDQIFITGDLNAGEASQELMKFHESNYKDSFRLLNPNDKGVCTFHGFSGNRFGPKIDFIMVSANSSSKLIKSEIVHYQENNCYPSDHFPVDLEIG